MAMTMTPQQHRRDSDDSNNNSHDGSHEQHDDSNESSSSSRIRVADASLRRRSSIESNSSNCTDDGSCSSITTTISEDKNSRLRRPRRRGRAAAEEFRLSATITRRHPPSLGHDAKTETSSSSSDTAPPQSPTLTSGDATNKTAGIQRRKKCRPRHRCPSTNESISSILKPSKYLPSGSSSILQTLSNEAAGDGDVNNNTSSSSSFTSTTSPIKKSSSSRFLRHTSSNNSNSSTSGSQDLPAASMHSFFLPPLEKPSTLNKSQKRPSCDNFLNRQQWVANGVDFCNSVEVHVFRDY